MYIQWNVIYLMWNMTIVIIIPIQYPNFCWVTFNIHMYVKINTLPSLAKRKEVYILAACGACNRRAFFLLIMNSSQNFTPHLTRW